MKMLGALTALMGMASASGYAENNTVANVINAVMDLLVALIIAVIPYSGSLVGIGMLYVVLGAVAGLALIAVGIITIFLKFGRHK
jgi:hypothetical protein